MTDSNITPIEPIVAHTVELTTVVINSAAEANAAHRRIVGSVRDAISIGEFLTMKKRSLPHGKWLPWLKTNIEFSQQTAWNYAYLYENRSKLPTVSNLQAAYKLLSAKAPEEKPEPKKAQPPKTEPASAYKPEEIVVGPAPDPIPDNPTHEEKDCMDPDELRRKTAAAPPMAMAQAWEIADIISRWRESDVTFHKALDLVEEKIQLMRVCNNS